MTGLIVSRVFRDGGQFGSFFRGHLNSEELRAEYIKWKFMLQAIKRRNCTSGNFIRGIQT